MAKTPRRRSPVHMKCEVIEGFDGKEKFCEWECDESRIGAIEFSTRGHPSFTAILHRNTKPGRITYPWQLSFFTNGEPTGDVVGKSCRRILNDEVNRHVWRLRNVVPKL